MLFNSFAYAIFLPIVFAVYYILHHFKWHELAKIWLVLASFYFYSQGSPDFFPFFMGSVVGNYIVGTSLGKIQGDHQKVQRRLLLLVGILGNVGLLGYYKYTDFFISNYNFLTGSEYSLKHIVLPIGISFFTFQLIAFLVDSYRGETQEYDVINYLLFITFFPQLIVGPIIHHKEVVPQFANEKNQQMIFDNIAKGLFIFSIGCAKKMLLADPLTTDAQLYFNKLPELIAAGPLRFMSAWFYSLEYTVSYYFDLSGYADMAIGLGWMFNINIPQNFNSPYRAKNFQDYWQRWHITLSRFLGNYIFRNVYKRGVSYRNYYVATMVTFFVSGFWHGSGWTFVVWGIINGALVCLASFFNKHKLERPVWTSITATLIATMIAYFVSGSWYGPGWMFVMWGLLYGIYVAVASFLTKRGKAVPSLVTGIVITAIVTAIMVPVSIFAWNSSCLPFVVWGAVNIVFVVGENLIGKVKKLKRPGWFGVPETFLLAILVRVLFVSNTFSDAWNVYKGMFNFETLGAGLSGIWQTVSTFIINHQTMGLTLLIGLGVCWALPNTKWLTERFTTKKWYLLIYPAILLAVCIFKMDKVVQFLYFQF